MSPRNRPSAAVVRLFAIRAFRLLWLGQTVSAAGDALVQVALVFAILHVGGNAADIGYVAAIQTVVRMIFLLAGGVWADRLRRHLVMLTSDLLRVGVQGTLAVLMLSGHSRVWQFALGSAIYGAAQAFFGPAATGLLPETVPAKDLQEANSLLQLARSFCRIGGPAIAGVLVAAYGSALVLAADAVSFLISAISLSLLRIPARMPHDRTPFLADLAVGWRELIARKWYLVNLIAHALWNFGVAAYFVLGPAVAARRLGGASAWGLISAASAAGAVVGGIVALKARSRRPLVTGNLALAVCALEMLALAPPLPSEAISFAAALGGAGFMFLNITWASAMQQLSPAEVRSRLDSYDLLISLTITPLGFAVVGPLAALIGTASTLIAAAIVLSVPCLLVVLLPDIRAVRRLPDGVITGPSAASQNGSQPAEAECKRTRDTSELPS